MHVLLISYHFFNYSAEGMVTAKLARALTDAGHAVTVYTSTHNWLQSGYEGVDKALITDIPTVCLPTDSADAPRWWRCCEGSLARRVGLTRLVRPLPGLLYAGTPIEDYGWVRRTAARMVSDLTHGDARGTQGGAVLLSRLNPFHSHLVPLLVRRQFPRLPWCAYFSDPWPYHFYPEPYRFTVGPVSRRVQERLLARVLCAAGSVVFPSERLARHLLAGRRAPFLEKSVVAPHLGRIPPGRSRKPMEAVLRIRHAGLLMKERQTTPLLDAFRRFLADAPEARGRVRIEFTGRGQPLLPEDLGDSVAYIPYQFPDKIGTWLDAGDVLLLVEAAGLAEGVFMPSKFADYLTSNRPILALSPAVGTVADYLRGGGLLVEPHDVAGIAAALRQVYDRWQANTLAALCPPPATVARVCPEAVVPLYETAFRRALAAATMQPSTEA